MKKAGFTLIELLVVISIIGILAALLLANMVGIRERARDSATKSTLQQVQNALRLYYNDNQSYPAGTNLLCSTLIQTTLGSAYIQNVTIDAPSCLYTRDATGDGYTIDATLYNGAGDADEDSADKCGKSPVEKHYFVCAN